MRILEGTAEIDLLIVDYALPEMNGVELIREACQRRPSLKTLLITGDVGALSGGISRVPLLSKPFGPAELDGFLRGLLAGQSARLVVTMGLPDLIYRRYLRAIRYVGSNGAFSDSPAWRPSVKPCWGWSMLRAMPSGRVGSTG